MYFNEPRWLTRDLDLTSHPKDGISKRGRDRERKRVRENKREREKNNVAEVEKDNQNRIEMWGERCKSNRERPTDKHTVGNQQNRNLKEQHKKFRYESIEHYLCQHSWCMTCPQEEVCVPLNRSDDINRGSYCSPFNKRFARFWDNTVDLQFSHYFALWILLTTKMFSLCDKFYH